MKNKTLHSCRPAAWALAVGTCLLLLGTPARAQWLVQDEKLYKLVKEGIVDKIATSGKGEGSFKKNGTVKDDSNEFHALTLTTKELLAKDKEKSYQEDAVPFFKGSTPNCSDKYNEELKEKCLYLRNIMGSQLKEIQNVSKNLEARNRALQSIMSKEFKTPGELQKKQYEMSVLQTVIANDQMRLQTALASYQAMRDVYRTQFDELLQERNNDKKDNNNNIKATARKYAAIAGAAATFAASKSVVDSNFQNEIFKDRGSINEVIQRRRR